MGLGRALVHELRLVAVALQFLTRVPVPAALGWDPAWPAQALRHFPLVGAGIGAAGAALLALALPWWPPLVVAPLLLLATLWLTVALHEDGLADSADALLGAAARERALAIMKDSRIGSHGAAVLGLSLLLRAALLAQLLGQGLGPAAAAWVAIQAAARAAAVALMAALPYAGDPAQAKAPTLARGASGPVAAVALAWGLLALVSGVAFSGRPAPAALGVVLASLLLLAVLVRGLAAWLRRRLGGCTGDTLGACEQLAEIGLLLVWTAAA